MTKKPGIVTFYLTERDFMHTPEPLLVTHLLRGISKPLYTSHESRGTLVTSSVQLIKSKVVTIDPTEEARMHSCNPLVGGAEES